MRRCDSLVSGWVEETKLVEGGDYCPGLMPVHTHTASFTATLAPPIDTSDDQLVELHTHVARAVPLLDRR